MKREKKNEARPAKRGQRSEWELGVMKQIGSPKKGLASDS